MAEKETMNRGWLQTHPDPETGKQQKFAPYTLSENILRRDGSSYESYVNSKINAVAGQMSSSGQATDTKINNLQGEIDNLELRADALEYKTANIEGADNDTTFYIVGKKTGGTHQVIAKIDQNGVTSVDFINANSSGDKIISLNDLYAKTNGIDSMQGPGILYISDPSGKVIARIDQQGVNSIDFTSYNGTTKITSLNDLLNEVIALKNTTRHMSANDVSTTFNSYVNIDQIRTSDNRFIIAGPPNGSNTSNVGFEVNDTGAHAHTFTAKEAVNTKNLTATGNISGISATVTGDINAANANITYNVDASTATIDTASVGTVQSKVYQDGSTNSNDNTFQFVGKDVGSGKHQIIAEIGNNGVKAFDFTTAGGITLIGVNTKADNISNAYQQADGILDGKISTLEGKTQNITATAEQTNITGNVTVSNTVTAGVLATNQLKMTDGSGKWYFVDDKSPANIVAQVDSNGITTTQVRFKDIQSGNLLSTLGFDPSTVESITINIS